MNERVLDLNPYVSLGSVSLYLSSEGRWSLLQTLTTGVSGSNFGNALAFSPDGSTFLVGASGTSNTGMQ